MLSAVLDFLGIKFFPNIDNVFTKIFMYFAIFLAFGFAFNIYQKLKKISSFLTATYSFFLFWLLTWLLLKTNIVKTIPESLGDLTAFLYVIEVFVFLLFIYSFIFKSLSWLNKKFLKIKINKTVLQKSIKKTLLISFKAVKYLLFFVLVLIAFFNQNISAFIYNELEFQIRARYRVVEQARDAIPVMIGIQYNLSDALVSDQKRNQVPQDLEKTLSFTNQTIKDMMKYNNWQTKIPFLPKKYKEYHKLKTPGLIHYQESFNTSKKSYEEMSKALILWKNINDLGLSFTQGLTELRTNPKAEEKINYVVSAKEIIKQSDQLFKDGIIDKDMNNFFNFESQKLLEAYDYYITSKEQKFVDFDWAVMTQIITKKADLPDMATLALNWRQNSFDKDFEKIGEENDKAVEEMTKASNFYVQNRLNNDLISSILAKFWGIYPKNI